MEGGGGGGGGALVAVPAAAPVEIAPEGEVALCKPDGAAGQVKRAVDAVIVEFLRGH
jgi:hypothetical protein